MPEQHQEKRTNFTPNVPHTCIPTSGIVCNYCHSKKDCQNTVERPEIFGFYTVEGIVESNKYASEKPSVLS